MGAKALAMRENVNPNLTQRSYLTAATTIGNYFAIIIVGLVVNPILLSTLGSSMFGTWKVCQRLLTYVAGAEYQSTQALKLTIAQKQSEPDPLMKQRILGSALFSWAIFMPFIVAAGAMISWYAPLFINDLDPDHHNMVRFACFVLVINLVFMPTKTIPEAVVSGMNQTYHAAWAKIIGTISGGTFILVSALASGHLVDLALAIIAGTLFKGVLLMRIALKNVDWLGVRRPTQIERRNFFGFSVWVLFNNIIAKLMLSSDIIILGLVASSVTVSKFVLSYFSVQASMDLVVLTISSSMAGLGGIIGRNEIKRAVAIRTEMLILTWVMTVFLGSMILLWNQSFVSLWVGGESFVGQLEGLMIVIMMTQLCFIRVDSRIIDVTLNLKTKVLIGLFSTTISIVMSYLLSLYFSSPVIGMLLGLMVGRLIVSISYPVIVKKNLGNSPNYQNAYLFRKISLTVIVYAGSFIAGGELYTRNLKTLAIMVPFSAFIVITIIGFLGLSKTQRKIMSNRFAQVKPKKLFTTDNLQKNSL